jgi:ABC-2 family transporter protein
MTTAIFWRFLWKEYRVMRAFWIAMACLAMLAQLALVAFPGLTHYSAAWAFSFALIFPALYAVACGATMFAAEKEDGTYEFLRSLPLTAWRLLTGKLAFTIASTVLLIAALYLSGNFLTKGRVVDSSTESRLFGILGLAAIEGLAWGIFFSLILRRPLQSAVLAIAAASLGVEIVVRMIAPLRHWDDLIPYVNAIPYRAAIAAVVLLIDAGLVTRWLSAPTAPRQRAFRWPRRAKIDIAAASAELSLPAARGAILGRLVWQTWRQSRSMMLMLAIGGAALALSPFEAVFQGELYEGERLRLLIIGATATLMGICVFLPDHDQHSLRFLGEQAAPPRSIWVARQFTWICVLAIWALIVHALWFIFHGGPQFLSAQQEFLNSGGWYDSHSWTYVGALERLPPIALSLYITIGGFACGQLASMLVRSGILAGFIGLTLAGILYGWAQLIQRMEISWVWTLFPIPFVLLFVTWLRTRDWISERNTWRGWLRVGTGLAVPLAVLLIAVPLYRIYQIPDVAPGFSPDEYARSIAPTEAAKETADMYRSAADSLDWMDWDDWNKLSTAKKQEWINANERALTLLLQANKRPDCSFFDVPYDDRTFRDRVYRLFALVERSAAQLEFSGKLDEAWERYVAALRFAHHLRQGTGSWIWDTANSNEGDVYGRLPKWAAQPGQSRERIVAAIKQLDELEESRPWSSDAIKSDYLRLRRIVTGGPDAIASSGIEGATTSEAITWSLLPWERRRALRLLNYRTERELELSLLYDWRTDDPPVDDMARLLNRDRRAGGEYGETQIRLLRTTFVLSPFYHLMNGASLAMSSAQIETRRRATHIVLALEAWKLDHRGELPQSLDQLVGAYLDRIPNDPFSGVPFWYVRDGMSAPPALAPPGSDAWRYYEVPRKPFVWSAGEKVRINSPLQPQDSFATGAPLTPQDVSIVDYNGGQHWRSPANAYEVWLSGEWFEIP